MRFTFLVKATMTRTFKSYRICLEGKLFNQKNRFRQAFNVRPKNITSILIHMNKYRAPCQFNFYNPSGIL